MENCDQLWASKHSGDQINSHRGPARWLGARAHNVGGEAEEDGLVQTGGETAQGRPYCGLQLSNGKTQRSWSPSLLRGRQWRATRQQTQAGIRDILKRHKYKIFHCEHSSAVEKVPRADGESPESEIFKTWLDKALTSMLWFQSQLCFE